MKKRRPYLSGVAELIPYTVSSDDYHRALDEVAFHLVEHIRQLRSTSQGSSTGLAPAPDHARKRVES